MYCASFNDDVQSLYNPDGDPSIEVTIGYNGTDCVVNIATTETVENIEYVKSNITKEVVVQEIIEREAGPGETIYVEEETKGFQSGTRQD
jgi:hypothetical protein